MQELIAEITARNCFNQNIAPLTAQKAKKGFRFHDVNHQSAPSMRRDREKVLKGATRNVSQSID
jgi:hypothetical protein